MFNLHESGFPHLPVHFSLSAESRPNIAHFKEPRVSITTLYTLHTVSQGGPFFILWSTTHTPCAFIPVSPSLLDTRNQLIFPDAPKWTNPPPRTPFSRWSSILPIPTILFHSSVLNKGVLLTYSTHTVVPTFSILYTSFPASADWPNHQDGRLQISGLPRCPLPLTGNKGGRSPRTWHQIHQFVLPSLSCWCFGMWAHKFSHRVIGIWQVSTVLLFRRSLELSVSVSVVILWFWFLGRAVAPLVIGELIISTATGVAAAASHRGLFTPFPSSRCFIRLPSVPATKVPGRPYVLTTYFILS